MILSIDRESEGIIANVLHEGTIDRYACDYSVCPNPVCMCRELCLYLKPMLAEDGDYQSPATHIINIDLKEKSLCHEKQQPVSGEDLSFAELFISSLDQEDFELLDTLYYGEKHDISEKASSDSIDAFFDYDQIEGNGTMWVYNDTLPFGDRLLFTWDNRQCIILDQFCLLPKCSCTDANLTIMIVKESGKTKELCSVFVDYRKREWSKLEKSLFSVSSAKLKIAIEEQIPDIYNELSKRHAKLKSIYAHCRRKHFADEEKQRPLQSPKIGRNDPCPCGSGKKYKKCCMGKPR
jgi:hypothetical protein